MFLGSCESVSSFPAPNPHREVQRKAIREVKDQDRSNKEKEKELQRLEMEKRRTDPLLSRK